MNALVPIILAGWLPVVLCSFLFLSPRRAVLSAYVVGWLLLPEPSFGQATFSLPGLPDWTKASATTLSVFLGVMLFDAPRLWAFRPRWFDVPALVWCFCPIASSLTNGLGLYDGIATAGSLTIGWGLPYLIGRIYFCDLKGLRELAIAIMIGGLVYVPLCWYEIRMSPQFHRMLYGYHQRGWWDAKTFGGWRPNVFLEHGLMLGMWMAASSVISVFLLRSKSLTRLWGIGLGILAGTLIVTAVFCKSVGAIVLLLVGICVLFSVRSSHGKVLVVSVAMIAPVYIGARIVKFWSGGELIGLASMVSERKATSIRFRLEAEDLLVTKALKRATFGWGGWGRSHVFDEKGRDLTVTDGLWVIALGHYGLVGLSALVLLILLPVAIFALRFPTRRWLEMPVGGAAALAVVLSLYSVDCLLNAMICPIYILISGGLTSLGAGIRFRSRPRVSRRPGYGYSWDRLAGPGENADLVARGNRPEENASQGNARGVWR